MIPVEPHVICSGTTIEQIEYELLDLQFLGIRNLMLLRGDKAKEDSRFTPTPGGHAHTTDLIKQVVRFNEGFFADGTPIKHPGPKFDFMAKLSQLTVVPKTFHCDIPEALAKEIVKCKTDEQATQLGIEWTTQQCRELYAHGVHNIHFYTVSAVDSVAEVAKRLL